MLGSLTYLLNSGSFSRSSRAEWQVIRVRSNCVISSGRVLPIWFSASQAHLAAQPLPHPLISVLPVIFLSVLPRLAYRFWSFCLCFPNCWDISIGYISLSSHTKESKWVSCRLPTTFGPKPQEQYAHCLDYFRASYLLGYWVGSNVSVPYIFLS